MNKIRVKHELPVRHHYLPEFYLKGFCRDGRLWIYDKEQKKIWRNSPVNTCVQRHYYTFENEDGSKDTIVESGLAELEGKTKPVIDKISKRIKIDEEEKYILAAFAGFLMHRVPEFEKRANAPLLQSARIIADMAMSDVDIADREIKRMEKDTGEKFGMSAEELVDYHLKGEYDLEIHRNASIKLMLRLGMNAANYFGQMDWVILHAPEKASFVTNDNPVIIFPPENHNPNAPYGILTRGSQKLLPLTQKVCLLMFDRGESIKHINLERKNVRNTNIDISYETDRFLIGRDEVLIENMVKTANL